jgi:hypothetical protein
MKACLVGLMVMFAACGGSTTMQTDARVPDAAPAADSAGPLCPPCATGSYCYIASGGKPGPRGVVIDAGTQPGCNPVPSACTSTPTCACITGTIQTCPTTPSCQGLDAGVVVTCPLI